MFVLPETLVMRDTNKADGASQFRMRLIKNAHQGKIQAATVSVPEVLNYDI